MALCKICFQNADNGIPVPGHGEAANRSKIRIKEVPDEIQQQLFEIESVQKRRNMPSWAGTSPDNLKCYQDTQLT